MKLTALLLLALPLLTLAQNATTPTNTTTTTPPSRTPRPPASTKKGLFSLPNSCKSLLLSSSPSSSKLLKSCTPTLLPRGKHNPPLTLQCSSTRFSPKLTDINAAVEALPAGKVAPGAFLGGDGCSVLAYAGGTKIKLCIIGSSLPSRVDMEPDTHDGGNRWALDSAVVSKVMEVVMDACGLGSGDGGRAEGWIGWGDVVVGVVEEPEGKRVGGWTEEDQRKYEAGLRAGEREEEEGVKADVDPEKESKKKGLEVKEEKEEKKEELKEEDQMEGKKEDKKEETKEEVKE